MFIIPLKLTELAIMKRIHHRFWWENILILPFFAKELQFDSECELFLWRWIQDRKNVKFGRSFSVKLHDLNRCGFFECQSQESCLFFVVAGKDLTRLDCYYLKLRSLKWLLDRFKGIRLDPRNVLVTKIVLTYCEKTFEIKLGY